MDSFITFSSKKYYFTNDFISEGLHGTITIVEDVNGIQYACKAIKIKEGIPNLTEVDILLNITHPYLVSFVDYGIHNETLLLVLEKALCDLRGFLSQCDLTYYIKITLCYQLASALSALHNNQFIHGDIKPENVLIFGTTDSKMVSAKMTDFSLSIKGEQCNTIRGTVGYMAPECIMQETNSIWDSKADIWALGCVFYEIMFDSKLFDNTSICENGKHERYTYYINQCLEWNLDHYHLDLPYDRIPIEAIPLDERLFTKKYNLFKGLFFRMMHFDPCERPNISEVLHNEAFIDVYEQTAYTIKQIAPLSRTIHTDTIMTTLSTLTTDKYLIDKTISILQYIQNYNIYDKKVILTTFYMASKVYGAQSTDIRSIYTYCVDSTIIASLERHIGKDIRFLFP